MLFELLSLKAALTLLAYLMVPVAPLPSPALPSASVMTANPSDSAQPPMDHQGRALVSGPAEVWDGATLALGAPGQPVVRLTGVRRPTLDSAPGLATAQRLADLIAGETVHCALVAPVDGGHAALCQDSKGQDLAERLLQEGMLVIEPETLPAEQHEPYSRAQSSAQASGAGLWAVEAPARPRLLGLKED